MQKRTHFCGKQIYRIRYCTCFHNLKSHGNGVNYKTRPFAKVHGSRMSKIGSDWDHVQFTNPSTDMSVDISTDISVDCRSTHRPMLDRYVGRHIDRLSADVSIQMCRSTCRPTYRPICRYVERHISIDTSAECRSTCRSIGYRHSADVSLLLAYW